MYRCTGQARVVVIAGRVERTFWNRLLVAIDLREISQEVKQCRRLALHAIPLVV